MKILRCWCSNPTGGKLFAIDLLFTTKQYKVDNIVNFVYYGKTRIHYWDTWEKPDSRVMLGVTKGSFTPTGHVCECATLIAVIIWRERYFLKVVCEILIVDELFSMNKPLYYLSYQQNTVATIDYVRDKNHSLLWRKSFKLKLPKIYMGQCNWKHAAIIHGSVTGLGWTSYKGSKSVGSQKL